MMRHYLLYGNARAITRNQIGFGEARRSTGQSERELPLLHPLGGAAAIFCFSAARVLACLMRRTGPVCVLMAGTAGRSSITAVTLSRENIT